MLLSRLLAQFDRLPDSIGLYIVSGVAAFLFLVFLVVVLRYGRLWFQAYMSNARVSLLNLVGMRSSQGGCPGNP